MSLGPHGSDMSRDRTRTQDRSGSPSAAERDEVADFEIGLGDEAAPTAEQGSDASGLRDRVASRGRRLFAPRQFLLALGLSVVSLLAVGTVVPLPGSGLLGVFLATFVFGLVVQERRYAEAAIAGCITAGTSFLLDFVVLAFLGGLGVAPAILGAVLGAVVGVVGTYFGRDLRHGLTREVA